MIEISLSDRNRGGLDDPRGPTAAKREIALPSEGKLEGTTSMAVSLNRTSPGDLLGERLRSDTRMAFLSLGVTSSKARCWSREEGMHGVSLMDLSFLLIRLKRGFRNNLIAREMRTMEGRIGWSLS